MEPQSPRETARPEQQSKQRFSQLDALRGVACLTVILSHVLSSTPHRHSVRAIELFEMTPFRMVLAGREAITLFFILSGFVLALPFLSKRPPRYLPYAIKRFFRIYVPYAVAVGAAFGLYLLLAQGHLPQMSAWFNRHWDEPLTTAVVRDHLLLVGKFDSGRYGLVFWTLVHEMRISLLFPLLMIPVLRWHWRSALALAGALSAAGAWMIWVKGYGLGASTDYPVTLHFMSMFTVGALLAKHRISLAERFRALKVPARIGLLAGAWFLLFYGWLMRYHFGDNAVAEAAEFTVMTAGGSVMLVWLLASPALERFFTRPRLVRLGEISYSVYLFHAILVYALVHIFYGVVPLFALLAAVFPLSLWIGSLSHRFVEVPAMNTGAKLSAYVGARLAPATSVPSGQPVPAGGYADMLRRVA